MRVVLFCMSYLLKAIQNVIDSKAGNASREYQLIGGGKMYAL